MDRENHSSLVSKIGKGIKKGIAVGAIGLASYLPMNSAYGDMVDGEIDETWTIRSQADFDRVWSMVEDGWKKRSYDAFVAGNNTPVLGVAFSDGSSYNIPHLENSSFPPINTIPEWMAVKMAGNLDREGNQLNTIYQGVSVKGHLVMEDIVVGGYSNKVGTDDDLVGSINFTNSTSSGGLYNCVVLDRMAFNRGGSAELVGNDFSLPEDRDSNKWEPVSIYLRGESSSEPLVYRGGDVLAGDSSVGNQTKMRFNTFRDIPIVFSLSNEGIDAGDLEKGNNVFDNCGIVAKVLAGEKVQKLAGNAWVERTGNTQEAWTYNPGVGSNSSYLLNSGLRFVTDENEIKDKFVDNKGTGEVIVTGALSHIPLNPLGDEDGDGLSNGLEETIGTDPHNIDTDGDNLGDGDEFNLGFDPNNPDIDEDGIPDGFEEFNRELGLDPEVYNDPNDPNAPKLPASSGVKLGLMALIFGGAGVWGAYGLRDKDKKRKKAA